MNKRCCHCFENILDSDQFTGCHGCKLQLHVDCLTLTEIEKKVLPSLRSNNIKIFCNRCNVTISAVSEVKTMINDLKQSFDSRFENLESLIKSNALQTLDQKEDTINESVERSIRSCNVVLYNVPESTSDDDFNLANDILEVLDPSLAVMPDDVSRIGNSKGNKPRLLKIRFKNADMARLCLRKKSVLLGNKNFSKIYISDDKTKQQQSYLKQLRDELADRVGKGENNLTIKYVNKTPKIVEKKKLITGKPFTCKIMYTNIASLIMKKYYIPSAILEKIKNDVKLELSINYSDNNEVSNNLLQNYVEPQSLQSLSNHNDSFCPIIDSPNTIQTDIHNLDLSYNDIHVINKNFYYHQNFKEQIEDEFNRTLNEFEHIEPFNRPLLPKQQSSKKFFAMIEILNQFILPKFVNNTTSFKKLHSIIYSGALTIIRLNGSKEIDQTNNIKTKELPKWEQRLNKRINNIRRDLGRITQYLKGINSNHLNNCIQSILNNNRIHCLKYNEYNETLIEIKDTLLQKLHIYSKRLKRYKNNKQRKFENKLFRNNEKLFYKNLADNKTQTNNGTPNINEIKEFWSNIWSNEVQFNNQAEWIPHLENDIPDSNNRHHIQISLEILVKNINSSHNWKSPGGDQIHNFWLKKFTCIHKCLLDHFNGFIREPNTFPEFLAHGITYLKPKDSDTKNPSKYRPITCLPTIYKIMTSCIKVIIYDHCQKLNILNEEQKGCVKECFGCKEQLIIDTVIMEQARKNNRNIYTAFIDYKKAYDSVPHSWLIKILKIYKINLDLINFLSHVMTFWKTTLNLSINNTKLKSEPIQIKRGIYQGDSLSPLWFCLAINPLTNLLNSTGYGFNIRLNNTTLSKLNHLLYMDDIKLYASKKNHILSLLTITENFSNDIGMSFGIDKCKMQSICRGHYEHLEYITQEGEIIKNLNKGEFYKYLGINQSNHVQHSIIKENLEKQFYLRIKSILKSKLNGNNLIKAVNTYAVPLLTYSFGVIKWSKTNLQNINIKTRVLFTKFSKHHPKSAFERFNLPRENGGRGFSNLEVLLKNQIASLKNYFLNRARDNTFFNALVSADKGYTPLNLSDNIISDIVKPNTE
jgi:hypothetical protein